MNTPTISKNSFNPFSLFFKTPEAKLETLKLKKQEQRIKLLFAAFKLDQEVENIVSQIEWIDFHSMGAAS